MGFRARKSISIAKGVRLNISKTGVGISVGTKGLRHSVHSSGRRTRSVGIPGTGIGWVSSSSGSKRTGRATQTPIPAKPVKPGLFAPAGEKALHKALIANDVEAIKRVADQHPDHRLIALTLYGLKHPDAAVARSALGEVFGMGKYPGEDEFLSKYLPTSTIRIGIAAGVTAELPLDRDALGLALAELLQEEGYLDQAIDVVEELEPTSYAALSLAELYCQAGRWQEAIEVTEGIANEDDLTALLLVYRAMALRQSGFTDGSLAALKEALRYRSRAREVRHLALSERALTYEAVGRNGMAKKDLERILAEDSSFPGVKERLDHFAS